MSKNKKISPRPSQIISYDNDNNIYSENKRDDIISFGDNTTIKSTGDHSEILTNGQNDIIMTSGLESRVTVLGANAHVLLDGDDSTVSMLGDNSTLIVKDTSGCIFRMGKLCDALFEFVDVDGDMKIIHVSTHDSCDEAILIQPVVYYRCENDGIITRLI